MTAGILKKLSRNNPDLGWLVGWLLVVVRNVQDPQYLCLRALVMFNFRSAELYILNI